MGRERRTTTVLAFALALLLNVPLDGSTQSVGSPNSSPTPAQTPLATSLLNVSLGESARDVRSQLGKPHEIVPSSIGDLWRYDADNGNATLEIVINQDQVLNVAVRVKGGKQSSIADPYGASLGMSAQALASLRGAPIASYDDGASLAYGQPAGVRWFYTLDAGAVTGIQVSMPLPAPDAVQVVSDAQHDGSTEAKAFVVKARTEAATTNAELTFLRSQTCDASGSWQVKGQELVADAGRYFDLFHLMCSATQHPKDFYFDITQSYRK
jgi:hypothetical protein